MKILLLYFPPCGFSYFISDLLLVLGDYEPKTTTAAATAMLFVNNER